MASHLRESRPTAAPETIRRAFPVLNHCRNSANPLTNA